MRRHSDATDDRCQVTRTAIPEARAPFPNLKLCLKYYMEVELTTECRVLPTEQCKCICRFADVLLCQHPDRGQFDARLKKHPSYYRKYGGV